MAVGTGQGGELLLNGDRVSVWENKKVLMVGGGDGCTIKHINLMSLNWTFKSDLDSKFYVMCIYFTTILKSLKKKKECVLGRFSSDVL